MSSLTTNKEKRNGCLVSIKLFIVRITIITTITSRSLFSSPNNLFANNKTYSLNLYSGDLQTTTVLFTFDKSSHKAEWITSSLRLLCLTLLLSYTISIMNVKQNYITTLFLSVYNLHSCCVRLRCFFVFYLFLIL